ncbi:MAG: hypothetical protein V4726_08485 [Verrucomicrobiota bacterium]
MILSSKTRFTTLLLAVFPAAAAGLFGKRLTDDRLVWSAGRLRCATIGDGKIIITGAARGMAARV